MKLYRSLTMTNEIIIYNTEDGKTKINLKKEGGTVWLSQNEMAELFQTSKQNISKHIKAIFEDGEIEEEASVNYKLTVQKEKENDQQMNREYKKYREKTLSPVEKDYLAEINTIKTIVEKRGCQSE